MNNKSPSDYLKPVAGNGLLHRRMFLTNSVAILGAAGLQLMTSKQAGAAPPDVPMSMTVPGAGMSGYGARSHHENHVQRTIGSVPGTVGTGASRTPLEYLQGIITPNALHFERHHNGVPDIDPTEHRLMIHGLVDRPLIFDLESLSRYPLVSNIRFVECSGNSGANNAAKPPQSTASGIHGLVSCSDWTGVPLGVLLDEVGIKPEGKWIIAEGADAAAMSRSVPIEKALDDAVVALYQNGERLRPSNGYPMRLLLPGWEGNANVKWLRQIQVSSSPAMTKDETSKYSDLGMDGRASLFTFPMGVKSVITSPSGKSTMQGPGLYQISGLAWSGAGKIRRVEVSADGGRSWAEAALSEPVLSKALVRFRLPWRWDGGPAVLQSRAIDEAGAVQPTRDALLGERGQNFRYHYHAIQSWSVGSTGEVANVYA
ncbi:MAG: sulfite dehydrogenase [Verrucomicrobia bacterium]|nr:sulfite dehydrogenase [Verrucomicrobiota bacterium]MDA1068440.1 sulfite dehydrogenase [Verrucomicrobiota bacterium]